MKNKGFIITLITVLSVIAIGVIVLMIVLINNKHKLNFHIFQKVSNQLIVDQEYEENFENINIDTSSSNVFVKQSSSDKVRVVIYGDKDKTKVDTDSKNLDIKIEEENCIGFCFHVKLSKIEVYLPKEYANNININSNYGDLELEEFLNANIKIDEDCGDVVIVGGDQVTVDNNYGDVEIRRANTVSIKEDCGDVLVGKVESIKVENSYGDIQIDYVSNYLNIKNDCGDIEIGSILLQKDSKITSSYGDISIEKTNEIYIDAKTDLGDVDINRNYRNASITLTLLNDCGDIEVNN